jgi:hypothetical protein
MNAYRNYAHLDRLKIIELLPKNKIKILVTSNFNWIPNGPIQNFFRNQIGSEFFSTDFNSEQENLVVLNGMLSLASNKEFQLKLNKLIREFDELNKKDFTLPINDRDGVTVVFALRSWKYGLFQKFRK